MIHSAVLLPDEIKARLQRRHCAHCEQFQGPGEAKFDVCSRCKAVHYW